MPYRNHSLHALPSGSIAIGIEESANRRVIVSALEVVEPGFPVVDVSTVAQGVDVCQSAICGNDLTIGVVACDNVMAGVHNPHHVTLEVGDVVVNRTVVLHDIGQTAGIVGKAQAVGSIGSGRKAPAIRPGEVPASAVGVAVGRSTVGGGEDVACTIVGIGGVTSSLEQLALVVVGVGNSAFSRSGMAGNIPYGIIGIAKLLTTLQSIIP